MFFLIGEKEKSAINRDRETIRNWEGDEKKERSNLIFMLHLRLHNISIHILF